MRKVGRLLILALAVLSVGVLAQAQAQTQAQVPTLRAEARVSEAGQTLFADVHGFLWQVTVHKADLTWKDGLNPAGTTYTVLRSAGLCSGTPTFSKIATGITLLTFSDLTVTPGNWCYVVTATSGGVESAPSNSAPAAVPSFAPTNLTLTTS